MDITIRELGRRLAKYTPMLRITYDQVVSTCRMLHRKLQVLDPNILYVGRPSHLSNNIVINGHVNILLVTSKPPPSILSDNLMVNLIVIPDKYDGIPVINEIQDLFAADRLITEAISKWLYALSQGWGLQKLLDLCYELLGNPVILMDSSTTLIAYSGDVSYIDEPAWQSHVSHGYVTAKYYDLYEKEVKLKYDIDLDYSPLLMEGQLWRHRVYLNRVVFQNRVVAYLEVLEYNRTFSAKDSKLISLMSKALAIEIQRSRFPSNLPETNVDAFMLNLLQNKEPNSAFVEEMASQLNIKPGDGLFVICIEYSNIKAGNERISHLKNIMERAIPCIHAVEFQDQVVLLMAKKKLQQEADGITYMKHLMSSNNLVAGVSRYYSNLMETHMYYRQADIAIKMGRRINREDYLYMFEDYMVYYVMHLSSERVDLNELCNPGLIALIEHDQKKKTQYALTLYHFIQNNLDMQKTSDELHIHYNTLKYRLQKIEETYGLDVSNKSIQLSLRLSFVMLEYIHQLDFAKHLSSCML